MRRFFVDDAQEMSLVKRTLRHQAPRVSMGDSFRCCHGADHVVLVQAHAVRAQKGQLPAGVGGPADDFTHVRESNIVRRRRSTRWEDARCAGVTTSSWYVDATEIAVFKKQTEVR